MPLEDPGAYALLLKGMLTVALLTFVSLFFVSAAYGRHARAGWGPTLSARAGWILMEAPSPVVFALLWALGDPARRGSAPGLAFLGLWLLHYVYRAFIYPFRVNSGSRRMPVFIAVLGVVFNLFNATINARWLYGLGPLLDAGWFRDPRFLAGILLFFAGWYINHQSDRILLHLRKPGETGYRVPQGGLYRWVSCPNYLGELIEWGGFALLTWSPGALVFWLWTAANLVPRAWTHHGWYRRQFRDYPKERRAIVPYLF